MKTQHDETHEIDTTPSRVIAERYRQAIGDEENSICLALLHYRGGEDGFLIGKEYCLSNEGRRGHFIFPERNAIKND